MSRVAPSIARILILFVPGLLGATHPGRSAGDNPPDPAAVERHGPAYRYPKAGWVVLHIEGEPYDRGYQHGRLLAPELADYVKALATKRSPKAAAEAWRDCRRLVNAVFLRRYDKESLEEMKGIADGAAAAGARFDGRPLDLIDVVAVNSEIEVDFLDDALRATPTGLEGRRFDPPQDTSRRVPPPEHCSAFAATGPATADGKIVFGHITMFNLYMTRHFNVWLDVKPAKGHRILMQTYPGGIQSGMDYYLNDAGLIVAETTIEQTRFQIEGMALASRIRKALQYADSIDSAIAMLKASNNGMYTNEWLLGDTKTNEIALFELGTDASKVWRSGKEEWLGGTRGFYWGCNNAKDLQVRLETVPSLEGRPANVVFHPSDRDRLWVKLYQRHKGKIDEDFAFEAFTTPPLAAFASCDAKFTTASMANELTTWARFGPPLGRTWDPTPAERERLPDIRPLVSNDWTVLGASPPPALPKGTAAVDLASSTPPRLPERPPSRGEKSRPATWRGTLLPATDADIWLATSFADYEKIVALELQVHDRAGGKPITELDKDRVELARFAPRSHYLTAVRRLGSDVPLSKIRRDWVSDEWYPIAAGKGTLLLDALRSHLGKDRFLKVMDEFGRAHAGKPTATSEFREAVRRAERADEPARFDWGSWLDRDGLPVDPGTGSWSIDSYENDLDRALIVYGTLRDEDAQREAADLLQRQVARRWSNVSLPIRSDVAVTEEEIKTHHLLLVGRPYSNRVASRFAAAFPAAFDSGSFRLGSRTYAHPGSALIAATGHPLDPRLMVVLFAGLGADSTWRCVQAIGDRESAPAEVLLMASGQGPRRLVAPAGGRPQPAINPPTALDAP